MAVVVLSKALEEMTLERDAAVVAKDDVIKQLWVAKRRLKEAEDEQYKAEEEATNLRAEVQALQHSEQGRDYVSSSSFPAPQELESSTSELEETWQRLQQEQLKLSTEQSRNASLTSKLRELEISKQETERALHALQDKQLEQEVRQSPSITVPLSASASLDDAGISMQPNKSKLEEQLHELASMVERLEKGRQKLLAEIDAQSTEIERLFVENAGLTNSVQEVTEAASQWETQVEQCLEHNARLILDLNRMRVEQAKTSGSEHVYSGRVVLNGIGEGIADGEAAETVLEALRSENSKLKVAIAEMQSREAEQTVQVAQLSAKLSRAVLTSNSLIRIYRPVLSNIEHRLLQLKQYNTIPDMNPY